MSNVYKESGMHRAHHNYLHHFEKKKKNSQKHELDNLVRNTIVINKYKNYGGKYYKF